MRLTVVSAFTCCIGSVAAAQTTAWLVSSDRPADGSERRRTFQQVVARDSSAVMERIAAGVYAIIHAPAMRNWPSGSTRWPHGNTGVIVGDDAVMVIDATYFPSRARADIALIRSVTDKPIRYLVITHWHGDHTHGIGEYAAAFPGLSIISAKANRAFTELNLAKYPTSVLAEGSASRQGLALVDSFYRAGTDANGRPQLPASRELLAQVIAERRAELHEMASVRVVAPNVLFDRELVLYLGGRRIEVRDWERANSPNDVTVYLPQDRVLFAGDLVVHPLPYTTASYPTHWTGVLRQIEQTPVVALVPGHGPVLSDHTYTRQIRTLFEAAAFMSDSMLRRGYTVDQVTAAVQRGELSLDSFRSRFLRDGDPAAAAWSGTIAELFTRMATCQQGYRC